MRRRLADLIVKAVLLIAVLAGATACATKPSGTFCALAADLRYRQSTYDAMDASERRQHLEYLKTREALCGAKP
jgi:type IV pilus biogenesis protein CpaD/CtpE